MGGRTDFQAILGIEFLSRAEIGLDCRYRRLVFPKHLPATKNWMRDIPFDYKHLFARIKKRSQRDMERRDRL